MVKTLVIDGERLRRLIRLCRLLGRGRGLSLLQLQSKLGTSRRTVFRELNALEDVGITIELVDSSYRVRQGEAACRKLFSEHYTSELSKLLKACFK